MNSDAPPCPAEGEGGLEGLPAPADPRLIGEGWVRRHLADAARAAESVELYRAMGYEVKVQELTPQDFGPLCGQCASAACHACVLIYTRRADP